MGEARRRKKLDSNYGKPKFASNNFPEAFFALGVSDAELKIVLLQLEFALTEWAEPSWAKQLWNEITCGRVKLIVISPQLKPYETDSCIDVILTPVDRRTYQNLQPGFSVNLQRMLQVKLMWLDLPDPSTLGSSGKEMMDAVLQEWNWNLLLAEEQAWTVFREQIIGQNLG
jgi:hypothetical protein